MSKAGFNKGGSQPTGGSQRLNIVPASPAPDAGSDRALNDTPPNKGKSSFLKNHWRGALWSVVGLFVAGSVVQSQMEHPQHSLMSVPGAAHAVKRVFNNTAGVVGTVWSGFSSVIGYGLEKTNMVGTGSQPSTKFIVCTNKTLYDSMNAEDPRATAYGRAVQKELNYQAYRQLALKDGPFYTRNAHADPETNAPVAVFHITPSAGLDDKGVPYSWNPNVPVDLQSPDAVPQKTAGPGACYKNEVFQWSPVPGLKAQ